MAYGAAHRDYMRKFRASNPEYGIWQGIFVRCRRADRKDFKNYGDRGICPCLGLNTYAGFISCVGSRPSKLHSIDRIDNEGGYWCGSCAQCKYYGRAKNLRWATRKEQNRNKRNNVRITWDGRTQLLADWAKELGIDQEALRYRLKHWPLERAMTEPPKPDRRRKALASIELG